MKIYLRDKDSFWKSFLESEGFPHEIVDGQYNFDKKPLLIFNKDVSSENARILLREVLRKGGVCIIDKGQIRTICPEADRIQEKGTRYAVKDFSIVLPEQESSGDVPVATIMLRKVGNGLLIGVEEQLDTLWSSSEKALKKLCIDEEGKSFAHETLCRVVKRNVRNYAKTIMFEVGKHFNEPIISLWRYPKDFRSVCNLRVDVDPEKVTDEVKAFDKIRQTFDMAKGNGSCMSFYVNFYRWNSKVSYFREQREKGLDIQSHNYFHYLYPDRWINRGNFIMAHEILLRLGAQPVGFVAPEYFWYDHTADILEEHGYTYSQSHGFDYNNYPYRPLVKGSIRNYIEVPNDPLVFSKFITEKSPAAVEYVSKMYRRLMKARVNACEPCLKYEHPNVLGLHKELGDGILEFFSEVSSGVKPVTLTGWTEWLDRRREFLRGVRFNYSNNEEINVANSTLATDEFAVAIQYDEGEVYVGCLDRSRNQTLTKAELKKLKLPAGKSLLGQTIYNPLEKPTNFIRTHRHRKKLIKNYKMYFKNKLRFVQKIMWPNLIRKPISIVM